MSGPKLMGVLNVTPDSFYDGGRYACIDAAIEHGRAIAAAGADILDVGGESTRPKHIYSMEGLPQVRRVSAQEELDRVIPVIQALSSELSIPISIDTVKAEVASRAIEAGASFINDVSGFRDPAMREVAAGAQVPVCVMHMLGTPETMQKNPEYPEGVIPALLAFFEERVATLIRSGVKEKNIILDPGVAFGKTVADNVEILHNLHRLKALGFPLLVGISRKSFIQKILGKKPSQLLAATLVTNVLVVQQGVEFIRVHDVEEHRDLLTLMESYSAQRRECCASVT